MLVSLATEPGSPDGRNEDWVGATSNLAIVLDGLSEGAETGCRHGTPWFVRELGSELLHLAGDPNESLQNALAQAIINVAESHCQTCDLGHPGSPCTTVAILRESGDALDYLVLSDSMIVFDIATGPLVISDRSVESVATGETAAAYSVAANDPAHAELHHAVINAQQLMRNQPGGYWVAQSDPAAARHARSDSVRAEEVRSALVLSDGAARAVVDFGALNWPELIAAGEKGGPQEIIQLTRQLEVQDAEGKKWRRYKQFDDASVILCRFTSHRSG